MWLDRIGRGTVWAPLADIAPTPVIPLQVFANVAALLAGGTAGVLDDAAIVQGYDSPGDGGGGIFNCIGASGPAADNGIVFHAGSAIWVREDFQGAYHTYWFGAFGSANDNTRLLAAHTAFVAAVAGGFPAELVYDPPKGGMYNITQFMPLPTTPNWSIRSVGIVRINQKTDNTECWKGLITTSTGLAQEWAIRGSFTFSWTNNQPAANTHAIGIALGSTLNVVTGGWFSWYIETIRFVNGYRGIAIAQENITGNFSLAIWQFVIERVVSDTGLQTGAVVWLAAENAQGSTGSIIQSFYSNALAATEAVFYLQQISGFFCGMLEINQGPTATSGSLIELVEANNAHFACIRCEQLNLNGVGVPLMLIVNLGTVAQIDMLEISNFTLNVPASTTALIHSLGAQVRVGNIFINGVTVTAGTLIGVTGSNFTDPVTSIVYQARFKIIGTTPLLQYDFSPGTPAQSWFTFQNGADVCDFETEETFNWGQGNLLAIWSSPPPTVCRATSVSRWAGRAGYSASTWGWTRLSRQERLSRSLSRRTAR